MEIGSRRLRAAVAPVVLVGALAALVGGCKSTSSGGSGSSGKNGGAGNVVSASKCGDKPGQKATGSPIRLGGIATKQPGTDFSDIPNMAKAYFDCVNANGGVNGHPIKYFFEPDQTDPGQIASLAKKLVTTDKVVGVVGSSSLIECSINHKYWESQGFYVIDAGIAPECYSTSHSAPVNMGPRYSSDGATQYVIRQKVKKIAFDQSNVPGTGYNAGGVVLIAKHAGIPVTTLTENVPIQDANSVALKEVQAAGTGGAVVLNFTPPEALKILQAAQRQGLEDRVKWACSTPCNTDFLAKALGSKWDGKFGVNAELNLTNFSGPQSALYRAVLKKYGKSVTGGLGSFSQMGFTQGQIAVAALKTIHGPYTVKSVNAAFKAVKDFKTDILCKPWYYGDGALHIPNNVDRTVTPSGGRMVQKEGCFKISSVDPAIAQVRKIESGQ